MDDKRYKSLLSIAAEMNLPWDYRFYDPVGLEQLIEDEVGNERESIRLERIDYYNSRL